MEHKKATVAPASTPEAEAKDDPASYTIVRARNVVFHESSGINLRAEWLEGRMYPTRPQAVPSFDDPNSFKVEIEEGKTFLKLSELSELLRSGVLKNSKLTHVRLAPHGERAIRINGILHKIVPVPVQVIGELGVTEDGRVSIRIDSVDVLKVPLKGVLHAMKLNAADLLNVPESDAIQAQGNSIYLRTDKLLPPPRKLGRVTDVHFTPGGELEEDYGRHSSEQTPIIGPDTDSAKMRNYIRLTGGTIRFGRLTMSDSDLLLIDSSPGDWFGFDLAHYREQLTAGDMHMTLSGGLRVWVPDSGKLAAARQRSERNVH